MCDLLVHTITNTSYGTLQQHYKLACWCVQEVGWTRQVQHSAGRDGMELGEGGSSLGGEGGSDPIDWDGQLK